MKLHFFAATLVILTAALATGCAGHEGQSGMMSGSPDGGRAPSAAISGQPESTTGPR